MPNSYIVVTIIFIVETKGLVVTSKNSVATTKKFGYCLFSLNDPFSPSTLVFHVQTDRCDEP